MEFELDKFILISKEAYLKIDRNNTQMFKITEKKNPKKLFTLIMMDGTKQFHADQLKTHLQCQSFTKGVVCVKGFKQMDSSDTFGFKVERTGWLVQEIETSLANICLTQKQNNLNQMESCQSSQLIEKLLNDASQTLSDLQIEDISISSLSFSSFVFTQTQSFKILDLSSAINAVGMESSVQRQIQGNPIYYDLETHRASLQGEAFTSQNYFKSSVFALGIIILEVGNLQPFERRLTSQEINDQLGLFKKQYGYKLANTLNKMLCPTKANRPDCIQLKQIIEDDKFESFNKPPPLLLIQSGMDQSASLAFTNSFLIQDNQRNDDRSNNKLQVEFDFQLTGQTRQMKDINQNQHFQFSNSCAVQLTNSEYCPNQNTQILNELDPSEQNNDLNMAESRTDGQSQGDQQNMINTVKLSETLRKKIKQYQFNRNQDREEEEQKEELQFGQGQGTSKRTSNKTYFEDESSDYIEEVYNLPISLEELQQALTLVECLPCVEVKRIKIDKYQLQNMERSKMLGRGTEGVVYQCSLDRCYNLAVKVLLDIDNVSALDIILTTAQVQSKKIKGIFSYDYYAIEPSKRFLKLEDHNCNLYMVSRRMRCDLGHASRELEMTDKVKLHICTQIASVLSELENVIIHGDIKPSNILLDAEYNISLIDFGMSRILNKNQNDLIKSTSHTYLYSPPEQVLQGQVHPKSDIWSFGIIIYELFTKKQITQDLIMEMGMYDEDRKGSLKYINLDSQMFHQQLYKLVEQMTLYDYDRRAPPKKILQEIQKIQNSLLKPRVLPPHVPSPIRLDKAKGFNKNKIKQAYIKKKNDNFTGNQLSIQGKQIKYFTPEPRNPLYDSSQTHISKKDHLQQQSYPTQVNKK